MKVHEPRGLRTWMAAALVVLGACSADMTDPMNVGGVAALTGVAPAPGSVGVDVNTTIRVTFGHGMASGMEAYVALHRESVGGPEVSATWTMADDHMSLLCVPDAALDPNTTYAIHVGGSMMDDDGHVMELGQYGLMMGGEWATSTMMGGGMMEPGGMGQHGADHMGQGWQHPDNGSYGMVFSFTTAG